MNARSVSLRPLPRPARLLRWVLGILLPLVIGFWRVARREVK